MELFRWGNFSTLHLFRSHLIIRADRGGSRPRLYVRDSTLLHDDLHDLHRVRKCCGRDGQREMLHCLHDDRLLPPLRRHLRARDDHHPQHDPRHGQVPRHAGRGQVRDGNGIKIGFKNLFNVANSWCERSAPTTTRQTLERKFWTVQRLRRYVRKSDSS